MTYGIMAARMHFAEIINAVVAGERVIITRHGKPVAAIVSMADYNLLLHGQKAKR